jgi:hypothetical protein
MLKVKIVSLDILKYFRRSSDGTICHNLDEAPPKCDIFELVSKFDLQHG